MKNKSLALIIGTLISVVSFGQNNIDAIDSIKKKYDLFPDSTAHFNKIAMENAKIGDSVYIRYHIFDVNGEYLLDKFGNQRFGEEFTIKTKHSCSYF